MSDNTLVGYEQDVNKLITYLDANSIDAGPADIGEETLQHFIYDSSKKANSRSQARLLSGLRNFFDYLIFDGKRKDNPTDLIESPKIGRKLPDFLSTAEIDAILSVIDLSTP
ncbi:MAG: site-specific integrase, partial [Ignavibacteria bacterium]|nr:site-specific integrase [Ignavibacteria bacterium]